MPTDAEFLAAIASNPHDDTTRLIYADWLDERNDARASYLRAEVALNRADAATAPVMRDRFSEARANLDAQWIAAMEQPRMLRVNPTPYPAAWWGIRLKDYRPAGGTYSLYPYDSTPDISVDLLTNRCSFLPAGAAHPSLESRMERALTGRGFTVPGSFRWLFQNPTLMNGLRNCTGCFFNIPARLRDAPFSNGAMLYRFYNDSQGCLHWYLYLHPSGDHCVVTSSALVGGPEAMPDPETGAIVEPDLSLAEDDTNEYDFWYCAPTFEGWLARWWLENELWSRIYDRDVTIEMTPALQAYIDFYNQVNASTAK